MLAGRKIATVCGNEDRLVVECGDGDAGDSTARFVRSELKKNQLEWLRTLPRTRSIGSDVYLFHGMPDDDTQYLLREVREKIVAKRGTGELENMLRGVDYAVILCGHDHLQGEARLPSGKLVLNPGSVGLPAYSENSPFPHIMAAGTPHARYSILTKSGSGWLPEHRAVEYDWDHAADVAAGRGRADWARWLRTGQA
jgi:predicted phosphodiesterase